MLREMEAELSVVPDSVLERYRRYDREKFYSVYASSIRYTIALTESLNTFLPISKRIDTIAIDHSLENLATAARRSRTIFISKGYFILYDNIGVVRSVIMHEFGHLFYGQLSPDSVREVYRLWQLLQSKALLYLFREGEYSQNAKFGGHPQESPAELYASAYNIFHVQSEELQARLRYIEPDQMALILRLKSLVFAPPSQ
jgi:hypothetical protein